MTPRDYLASLEFHGIKLGLDNIRHLMDAAGNPQQNYPTLHVAGTNGKGSVVAYTSSILRAAGYKVGRFTSPHLLDVSERFLINGDPIMDADLNRHIDFFRNAARSISSPPTYFEMCTAIALRHFEERKVDVAVVEVGMGGRYDSTNIVAPVACAITNIDLDHMKYLGDTLEAIAFEKAGIIKSGVPVVIGETKPGPLGVIDSVAREQNAPLLLDNRDFTWTAQGGALSPNITYGGPRIQLFESPIGLAGMHQVENAALALALLESVDNDFKIGKDAAIAGLRDARWPCRLELVMKHPQVYIDVAHNPAGIRRLVESMSQCVVVFGVSSDKDANKMIEILQPIASSLLITAFEGARATSVQTLDNAAAGIPHTVHSSLKDAISAGLREASNERPLLITGSIFIAAQARQILVEEYGAAPILF